MQSSQVAMFSRVGKMEQEEAKAIENDTWSHVKGEKNTTLNCSAWLYAPEIASSSFSQVMELKIGPGL